MITASAMLGTTFNTNAYADRKEYTGNYTIDDRRSGYTYMTKESKAIQDDDFENPAMIWVEDGEQLWSEVQGNAGKSCQSCHSDAGKSMEGVGAAYPKFDRKTKKLKNLEQQINTCRTQRMQATPWKYESNELLFALSNDPLKTQGILSCSVVALNFSATLIAKSSDSRTLTPPIMHKG